MKRVPIISPNSALLKTDDFTFFVIRRKVSTFENTGTTEDIFCVVRDSYVDLIYRDIKNGRNLCDDSNTCKSECVLPSEKAAKSFWNTSDESFWYTGEKTEENDKSPISSLDKTLSKHDYSPCSNSIDNHDNHNSDIKSVFDLRLFRQYLTFFFEIHPNSSISYLDRNGTVCSVQTETEFVELWQFAKSCSKRSKGVLLLIDFPNKQDDNMNTRNDQIPIINNQKDLHTNDVNLIEHFQSRKSSTKVKECNNEQNSNNLFDYDKCNTAISLPNLTTSCPKTHTNEMDMKLEDTVLSNINSQDFLNNAPPIWFEHYMKQIKKDMMKEVSDQVMVNVMKNLNKCPMKSPVNIRCENTVQCKNQVYHHRSKSICQKTDLLTDPRGQDKGMVQARKKKEHKSNRNRKYISELEGCITTIYDTINNIKQEESINNHISKVQESLKSHHCEVTNLCNEPNVSNASEEGEFRMNCSITEHQMLDKKHFTNKTYYCGSDTENISLSSDTSNSVEVCNEYNFEMISKPEECECQLNYNKKNKSLLEKLKCIRSKGKNNENTKDVSSFESLSEMPSPPPSSICIDENHFTGNLNNISTVPGNHDFNIPSNHKSDGNESSAHEDIDTKIYNAYPCNILNKCENRDLKELTSSICKNLIENSSHPAQGEINLLHTLSECANPNNMKTDVNNSHTSYMTTEPINMIYSDFPVTQHSCQAQTDLDDSTQSFHSHTTSITDNGVYCVRETNTSTSHDYSKHSLSDSSKPTNSKANRTCQLIKEDVSNKNPERKIPKEESNTKNGRHVNEICATNRKSKTVEPLNILPHALVAQIGRWVSLAHGTPRETIAETGLSSDDRSSHARKAQH